MQNKKGFTLVELVIVIAVIAILSGVLVGTFANIINTANESANLQKQKSAIDEIKANDILDEIDNENWYSINDFESKVAKELSRLFINDSENIDTKIEEYLQDAVYDYEENITKTNLTDEDLVMALVINSVNKPIFGGVTYYQAKAIVDTIYEDNNLITDIIKKNIVNNGLKKQLTAYDFAKYVKENKTALIDNQTINALHKENNYSFNFDFNIKPIDNLHNDEVTYWKNNGVFHFKIFGNNNKKNIENFAKILNSYNDTNVDNKYKFTFVQDDLTPILVDYSDVDKVIIHIMVSVDISEMQTYYITDNRNQITINFNNSKELVIRGENQNIEISTNQERVIGLRGGSNSDKKYLIENLKLRSLSNDKDACIIFCPHSNLSNGRLHIKDCVFYGENQATGIDIYNATFYYQRITYYIGKNTIGENVNNYIEYND